MARILAFDWDQEFLHVIAAETTRSGVAVQRAFVWSIGTELTPANGESLGRKLKEALKSAGATPAPAVACVGRERVVVKELHFPAVKAADEPALVRFQAAKDLSELPDDVVIDYAKVTPPGDTGEQHAFAVALKKQTLSALAALCRGAGIKLAAVLPRPHALAGTIERARAAGALPAHESVAILILGRRWAELSILNQGRVLLARSLAVGPSLAGEVQRSLAVYGIQDGSTAPPEILLIAGQREPQLETALRDTLSISVQRLEPLAVSDQAVEGERGLYAGAVGAAHLWAKHGATPINFAAPKQPVQTADPARQRTLVYGVAAAVILLIGAVVANRVLAAKSAQVARLNELKTAQENEYKKLAQDRLNIDGMKDWEATTVSWLDEFYDLTARFPHQVGFRLKDLSAGPPAKRNLKDKAVAHIALTGVAKSDQHHFINTLLDTLNADRHLNAKLDRTKDAGKGTQQFHLKIDIARHSPEKYTARFTPPSRLLQMEGEAEPDVPPVEDAVEEGGVP